MINKAWKLREKSYPYIGGLISGSVVLVYWSEIDIWLREFGVELPALFAAIFDIAAILTAFLFAFFGLAIAPGGGFIEKIFGTKTFRLFLRYIVEALVLGALLTVVSIPLMIAAVVPFMLLVLWWSLLAASMLAFYRVVRVFIVWVRAGSSSFRSKLTSHHQSLI